MKIQDILNPCNCNEMQELFRLQRVRDKSQNPEESMGADIKYWVEINGLAQRGLLTGEIKDDIGYINCGSCNMQLDTLSGSELHESPYDAFLKRKAKFN